MKKLLIISFLLIVVLLYSCKKEAEHEIEKVEANITLAPGEEFRFELKKYIKDKQFPLITKAPDKSLASTIMFIMMLQLDLITNIFLMYLAVEVTR